MARGDRVYWNITRGAWSVQTDGRVRARWEAVRIAGVSFAVRESGRQRAIRERQKNVHAFACGFATQEEPDSFDPGFGWVRVSYSYDAGFFYFKSGANAGREALGADHGWCGERVFYLDAASARVGSRHV